MSLVTAYTYKCDVCSSKQVKETSELPTGWCPVAFAVPGTVSSEENLHICETCRAALNRPGHTKILQWVAQCAVKGMRSEFAAQLVEGMTVPVVVPWHPIECEVEEG